MKSSIKKFKKALREAYTEGVTQSKRTNVGYDLDEPDDYDIAEDMDLDNAYPFKKITKESVCDCDDEVEEEGVTQSKRANVGYALEDPTDYDIAEDAFEEGAPPSDEADEFIAKNKASFKKRYGPNWKKFLYKQAEKEFPSKKEELENEALPSLAQKGADAIRKGHGDVGGSFKDRASAAVDAMLQSFRSDTEKRSLHTLLNKPEAQGGYKDKFISSGPSSATEREPLGGGEDPTQWKKELGVEHKQLSLKTVMEKMDLEFPLEGEYADDKKSKKEGCKKK